MSDLPRGAIKRRNNRTLVARVVLAWPQGCTFTTGDVVAAIPDRPHRSMTVRSVASILAGLDGVECLGSRDHTMARWRRV